MSRVDPDLVLLQQSALVSTGSNGVRADLMRIFTGGSEDFDDLPPPPPPPRILSPPPPPPIVAVPPPPQIIQRPEVPIIAPISDEVEIAALRERISILEAGLSSVVTKAKKQQKMKQIYDTGSRLA